MACCLVLSTASSLREARKLADAILTKKLAACVTLVPSAESHYCWKGKREKSRETVLLIKTLSVRYKKLEALIKAHHSYSVPEIIAISIRKGSPSYLRWIKELVA